MPQPDLLATETKIMERAKELIDARPDRTSAHKRFLESLLTYCGHNAIVDRNKHGTGIHSLFSKVIHNSKVSRDKLTAATLAMQDLIAMLKGDESPHITSLTMLQIAASVTYVSAYTQTVHGIHKDGKLDDEIHKVLVDLFRTITNISQTDTNAMDEINESANELRWQLTKKAVIEAKTRDKATITNVNTIYYTAKDCILTATHESLTRLVCYKLSNELPNTLDINPTQLITQVNKVIEQAKNYLTENDITPITPRQKFINKLINYCQTNAFYKSKTSNIVQKCYYQERKNLPLSQSKLVEAMLALQKLLNPEKKTIDIINTLEERAEVARRAHSISTLGELEEICNKTRTSCERDMSETREMMTMN